jgi:NADH:quinone reductase (non-electrogenic)
VSASAPARVVILGGGFAGLSAARRLERALGADDRVEATLVSAENYLLFTPMLAEATTGELAPTHIAAPLREVLRRVRVRQGVAVGIDLARREVTARHGATGSQWCEPYDHLVLALGSVTSFHHVEGAAEHALGFKSLADAVGIRTRLIDCFEQAAIETDGATRRALLTAVVAGGGYSGVELAAALHDFLQRTRRFYPALAGEPVRLVLAHHGERLLEELSAPAAAYTLALLRRRGIDVRLSTGATRVAEDEVELSPGGRLPSHTVIWTAGVAPSPFVETLPVPLDHRGAVIVDEHLAVPGHPGLWALGDCARVPDREGGSYGPTAQNAEREGPVVADNVLASLQGRALRPFHYRSKGAMASLGRRRGVGDVLGVRFSGVLAWLLWRTVYWGKLPGLDRKARVGMDWLLDVAFPPDVISPLREPLRSARGSACAGPPTPPVPAAGPGAGAR